MAKEERHIWRHIGICFGHINISHIVRTTSLYCGEVKEESFE